VFLVVVQVIGGRMKGVK